MAETNNGDNFDSFQDVDDLLAMVIPDNVADDAQAYRLFIRFLDARLANLGWTADDLARALDTRLEWVIALLSGRIPASRLTDDLLERLAQAIDYEPNLLRVMLDRDFIPAAEASSTAPDEYSEEIERLLDKIAEYLLERVDRRYAERHQADQRKTRHYDFVIKQVEMIVARHRTDIKMVEILIDDPKTAIKDDDDLGRMDILRLIQHIKANA